MEPLVAQAMERKGEPVNCIDGLQARVNAAMKALPRPEIVVARDEHASEVWSDYYQHSPDDVTWLIKQLNPPMNDQTRTR